LAVGAFSVPIYPSSTTDQSEYILQNSEAAAVFCEDPAQLAKVLAARPRLPKVTRAVVIDGRPPPEAAGFALTLDELKMEGWQVSADEVRRRVEAAAPDAVATIVYTSGTTGPPKGVVQTHTNHVSMVANLASAGDYSEEDENLLFLPLAPSFARCEEMAQFHGGF